MKKEDLKILKLLGKGKSGISYLADSPLGLVVFKEMHDEVVPYYEFNKNKVELELESYEVLSNSNLHIPELIAYNKDGNYLIKAYIEGKTITEKLIEAPLEENLLLEMLQLELELKKENINIDYFPSNFVTQNNTLYYVDYEHNPYLDEWNFSNWGIFYWLNRDGMTNYMKTNNIDSINLPGTGIPLKSDELQTAKNNIIQKFVNSLTL